jgi:hypothetical protein
VRFFEACYYFSQFHLQYFRIRAQLLVQNPPKISIEENAGEMGPLLDEEIQHCATVIAAAFLNPSKPDLD